MTILHPLWFRFIRVRVTPSRSWAAASPPTPSLATGSRSDLWATAATPPAAAGHPSTYRLQPLSAPPLSARREGCLTNLNIFCLLILITSGQKSHQGDGLGSNH